MFARAKRAAEVDLQVHVTNFLAHPGAHRLKEAIAALHKYQEAFFDLEPEEIPKINRRKEP